MSFIGPPRGPMRPEDLGPVERPDEGSFSGHRVRVVRELVSARPEQGSSLPPGGSAGAVDSTLVGSAVSSVSGARDRTQDMILLMESYGGLLCENRERAGRFLMEGEAIMAAYPNDRGEYYILFKDHENNINTGQVENFETAQYELRNVFENFITGLRGVFRVNNRGEAEECFRQRRVPADTCLFWDSASSPGKYGLYYNQFDSRAIGALLFKPKQILQFCRSIRKEGASFVGEEHAATEALRKEDCHYAFFKDRDNISYMYKSLDGTNKGPFSIRFQDIDTLHDTVTRRREEEFPEALLAPAGGAIDTEAVFDRRVQPLQREFHNIAVEMNEGGLLDRLRVVAPEIVWETRTSEGGNIVQYVSPAMTEVGAQRFQTMTEGRDLHGSVFPSSRVPGMFRVVFDVDTFSMWKGLHELTERNPIPVVQHSDTGGSVVHRFDNIFCPVETLADRRPVPRLHANVVKFNGLDQEYILTQAPTEETAGDLWKVAADRGSRLVVDLTTDGDVARRGIPDYAPTARPGEQRSFFRGNVTVDVSAREDIQPSREDGTGRIVSYQHSVRSGEEQHDISRMRYGWPDFRGTNLRDIKALIEAIDAKAQGGPVVVHCTAGVGRSGTLAMCRAVRDGIIRGHIENYSELKREVTQWIVEGRMQRGPVFVQTPEQLQTILNFGRFLFREQEG